MLNIPPVLSANSEGDITRPDACVLVSILLSDKILVKPPLQDERCHYHSIESEFDHAPILNEINEKFFELKCK